MYVYIKCIFIVIIIIIIKFEKIFPSFLVNLHSLVRESESLFHIYKKHRRVN